MMNNKKAIVILNPFANRWRALERKNELISALNAIGLDYELKITEFPGQGIQIAEQAIIAGCTPIISAGGDGSANDVINGMLNISQRNSIKNIPPFGIMPLGSANDLAVNSSISLNLFEAANIIQRGKTKLIDVGIVNNRYFANNSAIGLEPTITLIQQKISWPRGILRYLLATLLGVIKNPSWNTNLIWDGGEYHGRISLVTVGNHALTGGLFYMTPHANPCDGKLTFVYGYLPSKFEVLKTLPKTMKPAEGSYVELKSIHEIHSKFLSISCDTPTPLHTDGVIIDEKARQIEYKIIEKILPLLVDRE